MKKIVLMLSVFVAVVVVTACQTQSKEDLVQQGKNEIQQGNPLGAVIYFKNALEQDPNYVEARHQLGRAYVGGNKFEQAEKELKKVHLQDPSNGEVLLELVNVYLTMGQSDVAEKTLQQFIEIHPKNSRTQEYLGLIRLDQKKMEQAASLFDEAVALDPENVSALLMKIRLYLKQKQVDEAEALLRISMNRFPKEKQLYMIFAALKARNGELDKAYDSYQKVFEIDPTDIHARYWAGVLALELGRIDKAQIISDYLLRQYPKHSVGTRLKGMVLYAKGEYESAALALRESLKTMKDLTGYYFLGLTEYRLEQHELALNQFQQVLDLQPDHVQSRIMLGVVLLQQKRLDDCIYQISQVLLEHEDLAVAHNVLGTAYLYKANFDLAAKHFDRVIALDPSLADAHVKKGLLNLSRQNPVVAELELVKALEVEPGSLNTRFLLASLYLRQQNYQGVIDLLKQGINDTEQDALIYNYMAVAYFAQKKNAQGIDAFQNAKKVKNDYLSPYLNLANYYLGRQQNDLALNEYRSILEFSPNNIKALIGIAALEEIRGNKEAAQKSYQRARATETPAGYLALAGYFMRAGLSQESAMVIEEASWAHPNNAAILKLYGRLMLERKDYAKAVKTFKALEKINPEEGALLLTASLLVSGEKDKALDLARSKTAAQPDGPLGYLLLAAIQQQQEQIALAEETLLDGIKRANDTRFLIMQLGSLYVRSGRFEDAKRKFIELKQSHPDFVPAIFALGMLYDERGNKKQATELYQEVLDRSENHTGAMNNLAYIYAENNGTLEDALMLSMRAFRNEPSNPAVLDTLGLALLKNERFAESASVLKKATSLLPDVAIVHLHFAQALIGAGELNEAKRILQHVIDMKSSPETEQAQQLLKQINV